MEAHLYVTKPALYKLLKYKTDGDCLHSMNAPALVLGDPRDDKLLVLSFR
jgi:hypothetical protein